VISRGGKLISRKHEESLNGSGCTNTQVGGGEKGGKRDLGPREVASQALSLREKKRRITHLITKITTGVGSDTTKNQGEGLRLKEGRVKV